MLYGFRIHVLLEIFLINSFITAFCAVFGIMILLVIASRVRGGQQ